jgi:hypothetical protein
MNDARRKAITEIAKKLEALRDEIVGLRDDEQDAYDNMPESLQNSDRGEASQAAVDSLESAESAVDEAITYLEEAGA